MPLLLLPSLPLLLLLVVLALLCFTLTFIYIRNRLFSSVHEPNVSSTLWIHLEAIIVAMRHTFVLVAHFFKCIWRWMDGSDGWMELYTRMKMTKAQNGMRTQYNQRHTHTDRRKPKKEKKKKKKSLAHTHIHKCGERERKRLKNKNEEEEGMAERRRKKSYTRVKSQCKFY